MAEIIINKGEEFKISVKKEITKKDLFYKQYEQAADMLDKIVESSMNVNKKEESWEVKKKKELWKSQDFENNIIAFCGERGEGKSSAMMTFVNAVYEDQDNEIFSKCVNMKSVHFAEPVLIDPSLFDDVHNVLDIVLAKIFRNFYDCYNDDNQRADEFIREKLLDRFQRVYRYISLINNQEQMLDDEFDYEGNISKLTKLGESTRLKEELVKLVEDYLKFMKTKEGEQQLIIAIDDLDLCSVNAYKMAEQIRKYLIIPNVCIVISVKIEQLELCIREKNLKEFQEMYKNRNEEIFTQLNKEVQMMAERYVSKLIPRQRRIYLPKVQNFEDVRIIYKEADKKDYIIDSWNLKWIDMGEDLDENTTSDRTVCHNRRFSLAMLDLIYARTGMRFWPETDGRSYLLPDNLRDMISWILMIAEMKEPGEETGKERDKIYYENIVRLENYFVREWDGNNLRSYAGLTLQEIGSMDTFHMHIVVQKIMNEMIGEEPPIYIPSTPNYQLERPDTFFQVIRCFEMINKNIIDIGKEAYVYGIRVLYTIRIHKLLRDRKYEEITDFFNGYIWGPLFYGMFPMHKRTKLDRSRFAIRPTEGLQVILKYIGYADIKMPISDAGGHYHVSYIAGTEEKSGYLKAWTVLGLFTNIYYNYNNNKDILTFSFSQKIIYDNNQIWDFIQVSLENYFVALCNLDVLYDKINLQRMGVEREEYRKFLEPLIEKNQDSIHYARTLFANMDLLLGLKDFCFKNRDYKGSTASDNERTRKLVVKFFENIEKYMGQYGIKIKADKLNSFVLGDNQKVNVSQLYSELFVCGIENTDSQEQLERKQKHENLVADFRKKITEFPTKWSREENRASSYLINRTAENAKSNLDKLALEIQRYLGEKKKRPELLDEQGLCALYNDVVDIYLNNKSAEITKEMQEEYKRLVKIQENMKAEVK